MAEYVLVRYLTIERVTEILEGAAICPVRELAPFLTLILTLNGQISAILSQLDSTKLNVILAIFLRLKEFFVLSLVGPGQTSTGNQIVGKVGPGRDRSGYYTRVLCPPTSTYDVV